MRVKIQILVFAFKEAKIQYLAYKYEVRYMFFFIFKIPLIVRVFFLFSFFVSFIHVCVCDVISKTLVCKDTMAIIYRDF